MSILLEVNGTEYAYPETNDVGWGPDATDWAVAVTNGMLQKTGGLFVLLDDVDFGANFGLISKFYASRTADGADAGQVRLAKTDVISWRNDINDDNLDLGVTADVLTFNGVPVGNFVSVSDTATIDLTLSSGVLSAAIVALSIDNTFISNSAAIAVSKLAALTINRAVVTDASGFISAATTTATEIGYVNLVTSPIQAQIDGKQASGNYITALTGDATASGPGSVAITLATVNSNVGTFGSASSVPTVTVNAKGLVTAASATAVVAPAGTLSGTTLASNVVTSSLTSVGTLATGVWNASLIPLAYGGTNANLTAANGAIPYSTASAFALLAPGSAGQVLTSGGAGAPTWTSPLTNPMNTGGDMIYGGASGTATRLANGTANQYLASAGGTSAPVWTSFVAPTIQKFTSGSGTYTTPTSPRTPLYIRVRMVGGGGGGGGGGSSGGGTGGTGGSTTFGTTLLSCTGGTGGTMAGAVGSGGTASLGSGPIGTALTGGTGGGGANTASGIASSGGVGAASPFGGAGGGVTGNGAGSSAAANTGSGGSGAGAAGATVINAGTGGGAGGYVDAIISAPSATYSYAVGASGTAGTAGSSGNAGGTGGSGYIVVEEYYQ